MECLIIVEKGKTWAMRFGMGVYPEGDRFRTRTLKPFVNFKGWKSRLFLLGLDLCEKKDPPLKWTFWWAAILKKIASGLAKNAWDSNLEALY